MADRTAAIITIGGPIQKKDLPRLLEALDYDNPSVGEDYDGEMTITDEESLLSALNENCLLVLSDSDATGGMFQALEQTLEELKMDFDRHNDAHYNEIDSSLEKCRNGEVRSFQSNQSGSTAYISVADIQEEYGTKFAGMEHTPHAEIIYFLRKLAGMDMPPMRPLEIVE